MIPFPQTDDPPVPLVVVEEEEVVVDVDVDAKVLVELAGEPPAPLPPSPPELTPSPRKSVDRPHAARAAAVPRASKEGNRELIRSSYTVRAFRA
jgi:hypothetical protein